MSIKKLYGLPLPGKIALGVLLILLVFLIVQGARCAQATKAAQEQLATYPVQTAYLSYGKMNYLDLGEGIPILSVHGLFGGYDQAYATVQKRKETNRLIAPARFGYLGSEIAGSGRPKEPADAFVELLDHLGVEETYVLATSAGGTPALRFALDYPERTRGLILYCSAAPLTHPPESYATYQAPPPFLCNDYAMFLISPFFRSVMGLPPETIHAMMPIKERCVGVDNDGANTNPDMARHYADYPIESLQVPVLILHAEDDTVASYAAMAKAVPRFPNATFISFPDGGHMMEGHGEEIDRALDDFIR